MNRRQKIICSMPCNRRAHAPHTAFHLYFVIVCFHHYNHFHDSLSQLQIYTYSVYIPTYLNLCTERLSNNFHFTFKLIEWRKCLIYTKSFSLQL